MYERAQQALVKLALEPAWEAIFEPNSYGCATRTSMSRCYRGDLSEHQIQTQIGVGR